MLRAFQVTQGRMCNRKVLHLVLIHESRTQGKPVSSSFRGMHRGSVFTPVSPALFRSLDLDMLPTGACMSLFLETSTNQPLPK